MHISLDLIMGCSLGIGLFLLTMGLYLLWDRKSQKKQEDPYSELGKHAVILKVLQQNQEQERYEYLVRVEGEIWQAYSENSHKKGETCPVLEAYKEDMKLKI